MNGEKKMSKEKRIKIIRKIKMLFALANNNPNENEAQLALSKAKELLQKYNIDESKLDFEYLQTEYSESNIIERETGIIYNNRLPRYKDTLAAWIANIFDCQSVREWPYYKGETQYTIVYIGFPLDVEIAIWALDFTLNFVEKRTKEIRKEYKRRGLRTPKNFKLSYTFGFIESAQDKFDILKKYKNKNETINTTTLPVIKENAIQEYLNNKLGVIGTPKLKTKVDVNTYNKGLHDGKNFTINQPVTGNNETVIIKSIV